MKIAFTFLVLIISTFAMAESKMSVEEMRAQLLSQIPNHATECRATLELLNNQSSCQNLRDVLNQCSIVTVDENGHQVDVSDVVNCVEN